MKGGEARGLLSGDCPKPQVLDQTRELDRLAGRLGEWAQLLKLVNGFLRDRVSDAGEPLREAIRTPMTAWIMRASSALTPVTKVTARKRWPAPSI